LVTLPYYGLLRGGVVSIVLLESCCGTPIHYITQESTLPDSSIKLYNIDEIIVLDLTRRKIRHARPDTLGRGEN
jgi:hypothetical protein